MISTAASASLADLSAHDLLAGYRRRAFSPVEVAQAVLARIEQWEPHIAATWLLRPEQALAQARASEARWLQGAPQGLLDGVPVTIKDNVATEGDPTPLGTRAVATSPAAAESGNAVAGALQSGAPGNSAGAGGSWSREESNLVPSVSHPE